MKLKISVPEIVEVINEVSKRPEGVFEISPSEVSGANRELIAAIKAWRTRDLGAEEIKYLFIDGVSFPMRISGSIERVPVLVVIGVNQKGQKKVLGFQAGDKESATSWREFFKDLKKRGLDGSQVTSGVIEIVAGGECLLHVAGFHQLEDGMPLEVKPYWKGA